MNFKPNLGRDAQSDAAFIRGMKRATRIYPEDIKYLITRAQWLGFEVDLSDTNYTCGIDLEELRGDIYIYDHTAECYCVAFLEVRED